MNDVQSERSYEPITLDDLARLSHLAAEDRERRFRRRPRWSVYRDRVLCVALCQGAALHFVNGTTGVKDFDVWTFYAEHPEGPFPYRWKTAADFGESRFGPQPSDPFGRDFVGRRVDLIGRSLPEPPDADPVDALRRYLEEGRTASACALAAKAVVSLDPVPLRGRVVWATGAAGERAS